MKTNSSGEPRETAASKALMNHHLFIVWKPEYDTGIPIIDEQHKGIVSVVNSLYFGIQNDYVNNVFSHVIDMMYGYTQIHFQLEETFFEEVGYPGAERHRGLHRKLMEQLASVGANSASGREPRQFMDFLKHWWISHICSEDMNMRDHILSR